MLTFFVIPFLKIDLAQTDHNGHLVLLIAVRSVSFLCLQAFLGPNPYILCLKDEILLNSPSCFNSTPTLNQGLDANSIVHILPDLIPSNNLNKQPQQQPIPMMISKCLPYNLYNLALINIAMIDILDNLY